MPDPIAVQLPAPERPSREEHRLNPGFTFTNFVTARRTRSLAPRRSRLPRTGDRLQPALIYGGTGLARRTCCRRSARGAEAQPKAKVATSMPSSSCDVVRAYSTRASTRSALLPLARPVIIDVQFSRQVASQEELFYTFNASSRRTAGGRSPATAPEGMTRHRGALISRFGWASRWRGAAGAGDARGDPAEEGENDGVRLDETSLFIANTSAPMCGDRGRAEACARYARQHAMVSVATAREP